MQRIPFTYAATHVATDLKIALKNLAPDALFEPFGTEKLNALNFLHKSSKFKSQQKPNLRQLKHRPK